MKSIDLNTEFDKVQKGQKFDTGSITPRTTTNKIILDTVEISLDASKLYQENINKISQENYIKLENDTIQREKEIKLHKDLIELKSQGEEGYKKNLGILETKNRENIAQIEKLEKSSKVQIAELRDFGFETIYQENIKDADFLNKDTPAILRYGLNTESKALNDIVGSVIEKGVLHPYEEAIFQKAFECLDVVESADSYIKTGDTTYFPNNVVLVDIFDRSSGFINKEYNQTHTIALWKKKDNEIVLIDPSNIDFSKHLSNIFKFTPIEPTKKILYGSGGNETGYSNYYELKPKPRDCVDIAVKIGFELNEQQKECLTLDKVIDNMLLQLSNQKAIAPHMYLVQNEFVRTLQSTSKNIRAIALYTLNQALYVEPKKK